MIYINIGKLRLTKTRRAKLAALTRQLGKESAAGRSAFIEAGRKHSWGHSDLVKSLRALVGNKCWYTEVPLDGFDPNVDHFRPKGQVREIDDSLQNTGITASGYWWLAFDAYNYRLSCQHANQRRVDDKTAGGKWDYFPVTGARALENTPLGAIGENSLVIDPCEATDVELIFFDPDGVPGASDKAEMSSDPDDKKRVQVTIWLFHLDKQELVTRRAGFIAELHALLTNAHAQYHLWRQCGPINHHAKRSFNTEVAKIRRMLDDEAPFAGALRCVIRSTITHYPWISEFRLI